MAGWRDDKGLKSSYELAMERLRKTDAEAGVVRRPVTDAQKAAIAEIRNVYEARLAEIEVLFQSQLRALVEPDAREARTDEYRRDRERLTAERDAKIEKARSASTRFLVAQHDGAQAAMDGQPGRCCSR